MTPFSARFLDIDFMAIPLFRQSLVDGIEVKWRYAQRVNAGGPAYTDNTVKHNLWAADQEYTERGWGYVGAVSTGTYTTKAISPTLDDAL